MSSQEIVCKDHQIKTIASFWSNFGEYPEAKEDPNGSSNIYFFITENCTEQCVKEEYSPSEPYPPVSHYIYYLQDKTDNPQQPQSPIENYLLKPMSLDDFKDL
eukprot:gene9374-11516_t